MRDDDLFGARFGGAVEPVEVIGAVMEEIADFLVRQEHRRFLLGADAPGRDRLVQELRALVDAAERQVQVQKGMREPRHIGGDRLQILAVGRDAGEDRIGQRLLQIMQQMFRVFPGEFGEVDRKGLCQSEQDRRGDGALIVFDLIEIACRDRQPFGKGGLRQALALAQPANLRSGEEFLTHRHFVTLQL